MLRGIAEIELRTDMSEDEKVVIGHFEKGLSDLSRAVTMIPGNRFAYTEYLFGLVNAIEYAESRSFTTMTDQWKVDADKIAAALTNAPVPCGRMMATIERYMMFLGDIVDRAALYDKVRDTNACSPQVGATDRWLAGNMNGITEFLAQTKTNETAELFGLVFKQISSDDTSAFAKKQFVDFVGNDEYISEVDVLALELVFLSGDTREAGKLAVQLQQGDQLFTWRWYQRILKYYAAPTSINEKELLRLAGPFSNARCFANYAIAIVSLSRGEREKARKHFNVVMKTGGYDWWHVCWTRVYLAELDKDPNWPGWIEPSADAPIQ